MAAETLADGISELDADQEVGCFYCIRERNHATYRRGEAFLSEHDLDDDGVPSYVCRRHISPTLIQLAPSVEAK